MRVARVGHKQQADPNDQIFSHVVDSPTGAKFLCVAWYDPGDHDSKPLVTLYGPHLTDEDCWKLFRTLSNAADKKRQPKRKIGDWTALPDASRLLIDSHIQVGLHNLTAH